MVLQLLPSMPSPMVQHKVVSYQPGCAPQVLHVAPVRYLRAVRVLPYAPSRAPFLSPLAPLVLQPPEAPPALSDVELEPWLAAARSFDMNSDFDVSVAVAGRKLDLPHLMTLMKQHSAGKRTIQALADKLMLHRMLDNIGVPQLPTLLAIEGVVDRQQVQKFVLTHLCGAGSAAIVAKPTHQSNATGVLLLSKPQPQEVGSCIQYIMSHARQHMAQRAGAHESAALQSLRPGFMAQPKYESVVGFKSPLELRVVVLWGKARVALWWWGRNHTPGECPQRNTWLVRRPAQLGKLCDEDTWQVLHEHVGYNPGFDRALELFALHISAVSAVAETVAKAFGAPFLRADFFVGSPRWGMRLNEVAYGCGCEYRNLAGDGSGKVLDDAPAIAQILREGLAHCRRRLPSEHFLAALGAQGRTYFDMTIGSVPRSLHPLSLEGFLPKDEDPSWCLDYAVPEDLCATVHDLQDTRGFRSRTFDAASVVSASRMNPAFAPECRSFSFVA